MLATALTGNKHNKILCEFRNTSSLFRWYQVTSFYPNISPEYMGFYGFNSIPRLGGLGKECTAKARHCVWLGNPAPVKHRLIGGLSQIISILLVVVQDFPTIHSMDLFWFMSFKRNRGFPTKISPDFPRPKTSYAAGFDSQGLMTWSEYCYTKTGTMWPDLLGGNYVTKMVIYDNILLWQYCCLVNNNIIITIMIIIIIGNWINMKLHGMVLTSSAWFFSHRCWCHWCCWCLEHFFPHWFWPSKAWSSHHSMGPSMVICGETHQWGYPNTNLTMDDEMGYPHTKRSPPCI